MDSSTMEVIKKMGRDGWWHKANISALGVSGVRATVNPNHSIWKKHFLCSPLHFSWQEAFGVDLLWKFLTCSLCFCHFSQNSGGSCALPSKAKSQSEQILDYRVIDRELGWATRRKMEAVRRKNSNGECDFLPHFLWVCNRGMTSRAALPANRYLFDFC